VLYTLLLFAVCIGMFQFDTDSSKVILSLLNIILMIVPLISLIFTSTHIHNSYEFIELMLSQPVNRRIIFFSEYFAISFSLSFAILIGLGIPFLYYGFDDSAITLIITGILLTLVFISLAFFTSFLTRDKAKSIGLAIGLWFYFVLIYDAFILWVMYSFADYPLEKVTLGLISLNPIDLARMIMVLKLDISALLGYTGAFFKQFFGSDIGNIISFSFLLVWVVTPLIAAFKVFNKKDF